MEELRAQIEAQAYQHGVDLVGVAPLGEEAGPFHLLPEEVIRRFTSAVCLAARVFPTVLETVTQGPSLIYYHHYRQLNYLLDRAALAVARWIEARGFRALPVAASQVVDWERQLGHVSHKRLAYLAGLGWRGRNNLLVTPKYGAQVRLVSILTDLPLNPGRPLQRDCSSCRRCLEACPAGAIRDNPGDFDLSACLAKLKEFTRTRGIGQYVCGVCVRACPGKGN